jgi:DNA helicase HerA-like ATPase
VPRNRKYRLNSISATTKYGSPKPIGKTIVSLYHPSTIDYYWFLVNPNTILNTFDFVTVNNLQNTRTIGIIQDLTVEVIDASTTNYFYESYLHDRSGYQQPDSISTMHHDGIIAKVAIIGNTGVTDPINHELISLNFPVRAGNNVRFSTKDEVLFSMGVPKMETPIPAGLIEMSNGVQIPVSLDLTYLAGPDTAHVNVSGISGNSKSSYVLFLLQSAYQKLKTIKKGQKSSQKGVSMIIFNTKEDDLLYLEQKKKSKDIDNKAKKAFKHLNLDIEAFDNVTYFLPRGRDGEPNSLHIPNNFKTYSFELEDIYDRLDLLFSHPKDHYEISPLTNYILEFWPLKDANDKIVSNWTDLCRFVEYPDSIMSRSSLQIFVSHIQRFRRSPLFVDRKVKSTYFGNKIRDIRPNDVYVIDISLLSSLEVQRFIIGDVLKNINELYLARYSINKNKKNVFDKSQQVGNNLSISELPNYILIFLDEINRFIPKSQHLQEFNSVSEEIMNLIIGGRSRGNILFSAQQFKSATDYRFQENIDLHVFGKLGTSELETGTYYSMIDTSIRKNIARLEKGELIMVHPAFRHPVKIWFPTASYKRN